MKDTQVSARLRYIQASETTLPMIYNIKRKAEKEYLQ